MPLSLNIVSDPVRALSADILVAVLSADFRLFNEKEIEAMVSPLREDYLAEKLSAERFLALPGEFKTKQLLVYFADIHKNLNPADRLATAFSSAVALCSARGFRKITFLLSSGSAHIKSASAGIVLGHYAFKRYKLRQDAREIHVALHVKAASVASLRKVLDAEKTVLECVNQCRDLVNEPANVAGTDEVLKRAREVAGECGLEITVVEKDELRKRGFNGLLTVGAAGRNPPRMVLISYVPPKHGKQHLCLLGKGIVFDSGGLCLKPADGMWTMKGDMAGAAAVLYGIKALSLLKVPVKVTAILCLAENLPDSNAVRPGDIFISAGKKSVQVENTDAEGRLILSDGLFMAGQVGASHIVNFATLTGACVVALGEHIAGLMGNSDPLIQCVRNASKAAGEPVWHLPLPPEYKAMLESPYADINNVTGTRWGGALTAGLFLSEFVPENTAWAHLDIAGPAFTLKKWNYLAEGATGFGVRIIAGLPKILS